MLRRGGLRLAVLAAWVAASGCMTLREVPRSDLGARPERTRVRVETLEGLLYDFDYATFDADTLTGYRSRPDLDGPVDQVAQFRIPFDQLQRVSTRQLDWRRTGMVGGGVVASAVAVALRNAANHGDKSTTSGSGKPVPPY
jgi:hypothetical protein